MTNGAHQESGHMVALAERHLFDRPCLSCDDAVTPVLAGSSSSRGAAVFFADLSSFLACRLFAHVPCSRSFNASSVSAGVGSPQAYRLSAAGFAGVQTVVNLFGMSRRIRRVIAAKSLTVFRRRKNIRTATMTGAAGSSDAVDIVFRVHRNVVTEDVTQVRRCRCRVRQRRCRPGTLPRRS